MLQVTGGGLTLRVDAETGRWQAVTGGTSDRSWIATDGDTGLPFVAASGLE